MDQASTETFRFNPARVIGMGFDYSVEGVRPFIVIKGVDKLLEQHRSLFVEDNNVYKRDVLLEVTADVRKTTEDYHPSIRRDEGDASDKYVKRFETWYIDDIHDVKAVQQPSRF